MKFLTNKYFGLAYFTCGILFFGIRRFFFPFWVDQLILVVWAVGMAFIFIRVMDSKNK